MADLVGVKKVVLSPCVTKKPFFENDEKNSEMTELEGKSSIFL